LPYLCILHLLRYKFYICIFYLHGICQQVAKSTNKWVSCPYPAPPGCAQKRFADQYHVYPDVNGCQRYLLLKVSSHQSIESNQPCGLGFSYLSHLDSSCNASHSRQIERHCTRQAKELSLIPCPVSGIC